MPDDGWRSDDPFVNRDDPEAMAREERRREREERRRRRAAKQGPPKREPEPPKREPEPPPPTAAPEPQQPEPQPSRPAAVTEEEFWDEPLAPNPGPDPELRPLSRRRGPLPRRAILWGAAGVAAIVVVGFLIALFQPLHGDGSGRVVVRIPKGASVSEIGDTLDRHGVIASSTLFQIRVTLAGKRSDMYAGRYVLAGGMSYGDAIEALSKPPPRTAATITVPEGYSRAQVAPLVRQAGLKGSYMRASKHTKHLSPARYGGPRRASLEGFLFPDTFELKPGAPAADLVQLQVQDFKRRIKGVDMRYARSKNLTVFDVVTIASMIEREAQIPRERKLIASVVYNRLRDGMPLGIDATTRFAVGNYDAPLTESQLATDSPYNTRTHTGLPPGPIGNPGLASIQAAAHPAKTGYLYYVVKPGTCGEHAFSSTEAGFERDVARYNAARAAAGGKSPTSCGQ